MKCICDSAFIVLTVGDGIESKYPSIVFLSTFGLVRAIANLILFLFSSEWLINRAALNSHTN